MKPAGAEKLLGGYAAGILTPEERRALFEAAVADQALFDELMREESLRELLSDATARRELSATLAPAPRPHWWWWPAPAATVVATVILAVVLQHEPPPVPIRMAQLARAPESEPRMAPPTPPPAGPAAPRATLSTPPVAAPPAVAASTPMALQTGPLAPQQPDTSTMAVARLPFEASQALTAPPARKDGKAGSSVIAQTPLPSQSPQALVSPSAGAPSREAARLSLRRSAAAFAPGESPPGGTSARELYYSPSQPPLGLRYSVEGGSLTLETNSGARLRVFEDGVMIFDREADARVRHRIPVKAGQSAIQVTVGGGESSLMAAPLVEAVSAERAVYAVAPSGAAAFSVDVR